MSPYLKKADKRRAWKRWEATSATSQLNFRVPEELAQAVRAYCEREQITKHIFLARALDILEHNTGIEPK